MNPTKLDSIDLQILEQLQLNSNITNAALAEEVGLSPAPTLERVRKLEQAGYISGYHAELAYDKLGLNTGVFVLISLSQHKKKDILSFVEKIKAIPEIIECYHITGQADFLIKILTEDLASYQKIIMDKLADIEQIGTMSSMMILNTYKKMKNIPLKK
ncbi:MAG: Lrp/AsnC family transcriptional regulator [Cytophagaceae bacterium]|nr:Lrp/AsnC family transcriptional regulator [Cytophagaceae bacterium]MDW8456130.1 Lrp/AsnC family transcriptional regulator [Cytophagaceae bacterium]